jgi:hypothetical protein
LCSYRVTAGVAPATLECSYRVTAERYAQKQVLRSKGCIPSTPRDLEISYFLLSQVVGILFMAGIPYLLGRSSRCPPFGFLFLVLCRRRRLYPPSKTYEVRKGAPSVCIRIFVQIPLSKGIPSWNSSLSLQSVRQGRRSAPGYYDEVVF